MPKNLIATMALFGLACATPAPAPSSRMASGKAGSIKNRAAGAHSGLKSRRAATTAKARRKELEKRPQALDTLRQRKPRPEVKAPKKAEIRKERPGWTKNPPTADGTFIYGLGSAGYVDDTGLNSAWNQARDRAYTEVASQLKVQIQGRAKDYQAEFSQGGKTASVSSFSEAVSSHVDATLEGVELHDRYQDKKLVWVLARFNKAELDALLLARLESLKAEVYDRIAEARASLAKGDGVNALAAALRAAVARRNLFGMPVDIDSKTADSVIEGLVRNAAGLVRIESNGGLSGTSGDQFTLSVSVTNKGQPADGVPVRFNVVGGIAHPLRLVSTRGGRARQSSVRIFGRSPRLQAQIDLATLASVDFGENRWLKRQFGRELVALSSEIDVSLQPLGVRLDGEVEPSIVAALANRLGITTGRDSIWTVSLGINDLGCRDLSMRRTCAVEATLGLSDGKGYSYSVQRKVRGTASDDGEASAQIEKRLPGLLIKHLIRNMTAN
jgi:hypothetical protein